MSAFTALGNKGILNCNVIYVTSPNQKRIGCVRGPLVAVTAAFDRKAQTVFASEAHRCRNVIRVSGRNSVSARLARPGVDPTQCLRESRMVAHVIRILDVFKKVRTRGAARSLPACGEWWIYGHQVSTDGLV
jgi:hypothetical protein